MKCPKLLTAGQVGFVHMSKTPSTTIIYVFSAKEHECIRFSLELFPLIVRINIIICPEKKCDSY
jgi:hypothetical protein